MKKHKFFTSESVTEGHPDKIADQISDAVLDAIFEKDPNARVACETLVTTGQVHVVGEISTQTYVDIPKCRGGLTGSDICKLYYDPMTRKQYDLDDWLSQQKANF